MCYLCMQRLFQILQDGTSSYHATLQMVDAKALQRLHVEVLVKLLMGRLLSKYPVVKFKRHQAITKVTLEVVLPASVVKHLLRLEVTYQLFYIVVGALTRQELTRRDIKEGNATRGLAKMDSSQEIVFFIVKNGILHRHTWRHQFCDTSLHQLFSQLGVFQLVADSYALTCPDKLGQIGVQGMMGKASHLVAFVIAVIAMSQRDA